MADWATCVVVMPSVPHSESDARIHSWVTSSLRQIGGELRRFRCGYLPGDCGRTVFVSMVVRGYEFPVLSWERSFRELLPLGYGQDVQFRWG